ncbi:hypothetical protein LBMAG45_15940 [Nitrospirota bacterium]|nr:hypothetical protein LBMAG45_15940 [Nitrospirota bacterium]
MKRGWSWSRASRFLADQNHEVRFETSAVFRGVAQQDFDQAAFAGAEMPLYPASRQTVQEGDRLLC